MAEQRFQSSSGTLQVTQTGPVRVRMVDGKTGGGLLELMLDYEKAEVPSRAYFADYVDVFKGRADVTLLFGKLMPKGGTLRSQLEISFSESSFVAQLWKSTRSLHQGLREKVKKLQPLEGVVYSGNVHSSRANNVFMARLGEEAVLDFYYIAPSELHFVTSGKRTRVNLEPVVRVATPSPILLEFLDKCEEVISSIPEAAAILKEEVHVDE